MAEASKPPSGPDFTRGVPLASLPEGTPLLGHAGEEAVVLVRRGDDVHAAGASCTHYGGPLAEGLVVGDTIRCPWHHACFDLRTGEAIGAPALNPIACWEVRREGDVVRLGAKREATPGRKPVRAPTSVIIVGAGPAGAACAEAVRREGYRGPVTIAGAELPGPVDRPNLSKDYLAGDAPEEWIPLRGADFYTAQNIDLLVDQPVTSIDVRARTVTLRGGRALPYGALVLATGAEPRRLSVPGGDRALLLRTLADSRAIIARAEKAKGGQVVVIGASFIGLEVAASLRHRGLEVHVVGPEAVPLARVLGDEIGAHVRAVHEAHGTRFHLGRSVESITEDEVVLVGGERLRADLVVAGVGVTPRTALAEAAGLRVDNGIVVDDHLRTSAEHVWAAGDVARYPDPRTGDAIRVEHFAAAERQGQGAARALLGGGPFRDAPFFWSQHHDLKISYVGNARAWDRIETRGSLAAGDYAAFYVRAGRVLAVLTVGRDKLALRAAAAIEADDDTALAALMAA